MPLSNNITNIITPNDFQNAGNIKFLECALTSSWQEFEFADTPFHIFIDNSPGTDIDGAAADDVDVKFTDAQTENYRVPFGVIDQLAPYRSSSIFLKSVSVSFKVNVGYYVAGVQT